MRLKILTFLLVIQAGWVSAGSYYTHYTNANAQVFLTLQTNTVAFGSSLTLQAVATGYIAGRSAPGPVLSIPAQVVIDGQVQGTLSLPWSPYGPPPITSSIPIRVVEGQSIVLQHTNAFEYNSETIYTHSVYHPSPWGSWYDYYYNVYHYRTVVCSNVQPLTVLPPANFHRLQSEVSKMHELLVEDAFEGNAGSVPNGAEFGVNGEIQLDGHYVRLNPMNLPQATLISWDPATLPQKSLRFRASCNYVTGGNGSPRGLRNGSDPNNVIEFVSSSAWVMTLRARSNGFTTELNYTLPTNNVTALHDYEIQATPSNAVFQIDGVVVGTITNNVPTTLLNFYVNVRPPTGSYMGLSIDSVYFAHADTNISVLQLSYTGKPTNFYAFQWSTNLVDWTSFRTNQTDTNCVTTFCDPIIEPSKFYRAYGP